MVEHMGALGVDRVGDTDAQKISIVRGLSTRAFGRIDVPGHADTANDSTASWDSNIDAVDPGPADGRLATSHARWGCASSTAPSTPAWPPPCTPWRARRHARRTGRAHP